MSAEPFIWACVCDQSNCTETQAISMALSRSIVIVCMFVLSFCVFQFAGQYRNETNYRHNINKEQTNKINKHRDVSFKTNPFYACIFSSQKNV